MFGENLRLVRTITCYGGGSTIEVDDEVENLSGREDYLFMLYHCNFGYPLVSPALRIESEAEVTARDESAAAGLSRWNVLEEPEPGAAEQCFYHDFRKGTGTGIIRLCNQELGVAAEVRCNTAELPRMVEWKCIEEGNYVLGIEPSNSRICGREAEISSGTARRIGSGEKIALHVEIRFEQC